MEIAVYVRVSTQRQQQAQAIDQQLGRLQRYIATQPAWHLAEQHIYRDDGYSGAKLNRPGLDRLRDHALLAAVEVVLLTAPDRVPATTHIHSLVATFLRIPVATYTPSARRNSAVSKRHEGGTRCSGS